MAREHRHLEAAELLAHDRVVGGNGVERARAKVELVLEERGAEHVRDPGPQMHPRVRITPVQLGYGRRQVAEAPDRAGADADRPGVAAPQRLELGEGVAMLELDQAGAPAQHLAERGERHAARVAVEQGNPEPLLELADVLGQGGLADTECDRRRPQAATVGHGEELVQ